MQDKRKSTEAPCFSCLLFDMDGTLLNTLGDLADACNWTLGQMGLPSHPEQDYRYFVGDGAAKLCERMLPSGARDGETLRRARALFDGRYQQHLFDRTAPYRGIPALLDQLREAGIPLGVVSNKPDPFVRMIAARYFPGVFMGAAGPREGRVKPDPSGVLTLLRQLGVPPERVMYIGDSAVDVRTAQNAGMVSCGAAWGFRGEAELREAGADYIAHEPEEIFPLAMGEGLPAQLEK